MAAALPSQPPAPLRAKCLGRLRLESRKKAREYGAKSLAVAAANCNNAALGRDIGGEHAGAQARTGALVLTPAEVALLAPLDVALRHLSDVLRERIARELASPECTDEQAMRLRLALVHLDAVGVVAGR